MFSLYSYMGKNRVKVRLTEQGKISKQQGYSFPREADLSYVYPLSGIYYRRGGYREFNFVSNDPNYASNFHFLATSENLELAVVDFTTLKRVTLFTHRLDNSLQGIELVNNQGDVVFREGIDFQTSCPHVHDIEPGERIIGVKST